jgi:cell division septum initiation protein DivIVA
VQSYPAYVYAAPDDSDAYAQNNQAQQDEIDRLNQEVARLRDEEQSSSPPSSTQAQVHGETVLVFRDRHTEEIQNYAIVGKTLWIFTEQRARKIPITDLDVPATTKANEDRGVDFRLPR